MNRAVSESMPGTLDAQAWSARNQHWLTARIRHWQAALANRAASVTPVPTALPDDTAEDDFEPAALRIATQFGLSNFERELLVLAAGIEIDAPLRAAVTQAQGTAPNQTLRLAYSLALGLLPQPHWDALSPLAPLRHWSLLEFDSAAGFTQATVRIDERILHALTGVAAFDERLSGLAQFDPLESAAAASPLAARIAQAIAGVREPLVLLALPASDSAAEGAGRRSGRALAAAVFARSGLATLWLDAAALASCATDARDLAVIARRLDREAALTGAGIAFALGSEPATATLAVRLIAALRSPVCVLGALSPLQLADLPMRQTLRYSLPKPPAAGAQALTPALASAAETALQQFHVDPALLEQALDSIAIIDDPAAAEIALWDALREAARGGLDTLAQRIESRAGFDDLVLPPMVKAQLRQIAGQLANRHRVYDDWGFGAQHARGLGIAALFAGESGTGKTLAAEAIANAARLDLYRIDLSSVVSKYIGETEKNLARLFDEAERSGAVLLFDEADALFGKRSEVKDSHDRYANIEVAYLLQRIESYRGLAILTTNLRSSLDRAFTRRLRFIVNFAFPDEAAREAIWRRQFPARAPLGAIDYGALARLQLSGGHIRSVALNAAFDSAALGEPIDQAALLSAARAEFAKLERNYFGPAGVAA